MSRLVAAGHLPASQLLATHFLEDVMARKPVSEWTLIKGKKTWKTSDPAERVALLADGWKIASGAGVQTKARTANTAEKK